MELFGLEADKHGIILPEEEERPICRTCKKAVPTKGGNTSNLLTHLRDHHPDLHAETIPHCSHTSTKRQPTLHDVIDKTKKYDPKSSQAQQLNRAVAYYIAKDMPSFYTVEKPGFRNLIHTLDPKYNRPSRKYFTKQEIPRMYGEVKEVVKAKVRGAKHFAATIDL